MSYYDFWREWEQRGIMEQAQSQIARRDAAFQAWADEVRREVATLTVRGWGHLVEGRLTVVEQATAQHMREMAEMQMQAEQQIAAIDQRYATEAALRERSEAESRERWANIPNNTPHSPLLDWRTNEPVEYEPFRDVPYTPAPAYTPRSSDGPSPDPNAPDLSAWVDGMDAPAEQRASLLDTLRAWLS